MRTLGKAVLAGLLERYELTLRAPADLDVSREVPHMLDFFAIRLAAAPRVEAPRATETRAVSA